MMSTKKKDSYLGRQFVYELNHSTLTGEKRKGLEEFYFI